MNRHHMNRTLIIANLVALFCCVGLGAASEVKPFNPSLLPVPKVELPAVPDDGSGVYRLNLDQALGKAPFTVVLEVQRGMASVIDVGRVSCARRRVPVRSSQIDAQTDAARRGQCTD